MPVKIAVASDLHCHATASQPTRESFLLTDTARSPWKQHPVESLKRLISANALEADFLFSPGDLTNRCSLEGLRHGWDSVREIASALGGADIVATLGNHDVDSK